MGSRSHFIAFGLFLAITIAGYSYAFEPLVLGRTARAYSLPGGENRVTLVFSLFNMTNRDIYDAVLQDTFIEGVRIVGSDPAPSRMGEGTFWCVGKVPSQDVREVYVELAVDNLSFDTPFDSGAMAIGRFFLTPVTATALPAMVSDVEALAEYLEPTMDADSEDPYVRRKAAALSYDPRRIMDYLHREVGFELYDGSLRGARGTLWSEGGNAMDQASLLIALLRSSNVPARYAEGTIAPEGASGLIGRMFNERTNLSGSVPDHVPVSNPSANPAFIAEATAHTWVEYWHAGAWRAVDPCIPEANLESAPYVEPATRYIEVPDERRHKIHFRTTVEILDQFNNLNISHPVNVTLRTVETVGRPLTVGHGTRSYTEGGALVGIGLFQEYKPFVAVGPHAIQGTTYREQTQGTGLYGVTKSYLVAEWVDVEIESPDGNRKMFRRTWLDRLGFVRRERGERLFLGDFAGNPPALPALSELDFFTIYAPVSKTDPSVVENLKREFQHLRDELSAIAPALLLVNEENPTPEDAALIRKGNLLFSEIAVLMTRLAGTYFALHSDISGKGLEQGFGVRAYSDSPRLIFSNTLVRDANVEVRLDLRRTDERIVVEPGQFAFTDYFYRSAKGRLDAGLEAVALENAVGATQEAVISTLTVLKAAMDQNIQVIQVSEEDVNLIGTLGISEEARLRVKYAVEAGKAVQIPVQAPLVNGQPRIGWWETDGITGQTYAVTEDGGHQAIIELPAILFGNANVIAGAAIGVMTGAANNFIGFVGNFFAALNDTGDPRQAIRTAKNKSVESALIGCAGSFGPVLPELIDAGRNVRDAASFVEYCERALSRALSNAITGRMGFSGTAITMGQCLGESAAYAYLQDVFKNDPEIPPYYIDVLAFDTFPSSIAAATDISVNAPISPFILGTVKTDIVSASGGLSLSLDPENPIGLSADALTMGSAQLRNASGELVGSGNVTLGTAKGVPVIIESAGGLTFSGTGSLTRYGSVLGTTVLGSDWKVFDAMAQGNVSLRIYGIPYLNGSPRLYGEYTVTAQTAEIKGSGGMVLIGADSDCVVAAEKAVLGLGTGEGALWAGYFQLPINGGIGLSGYDGNVTFGPEEAGLNPVTLQGPVERYLQLTIAPRDDYSFTTNDADFVFDWTARGQTGEQVLCIAEAPEHWGARFDEEKAAWLIPPATLETGPFTSNFFVESIEVPGLFAQANTGGQIGFTSMGIDLNVEHQPLRFLAREGVRFPGIFEVSVKGRSPNTVQVALTQTGEADPAISFGATEIAVMGTSTAYTYLYVDPVQPLPAPGSVYSVPIRAEQVGNPTVFDTATAQLTVPEIKAGWMSADKGLIYTTDNLPKPVALTVTNTGNVGANFFLSIERPGGFTITYSNPGVLAPGASHTQTLTIRPDVAVVGLNGLFGIGLQIDGQPHTRIGIAMEVVSAPEIAAAFMAAESARNKALFYLWEDLLGLGNSLKTLRGQMGNTGYRDDVIGWLGMVRSDLVPGLEEFNSRITDVSIRMAGASGNDLIPILNDLKVILDDLAEAVDALVGVPGDLNGDGISDWKDLFIFLQGWMTDPADPALADLNQDGSANGADLLELIRTMGK